MLADGARAALARPAVALVEASAEALPFEDDDVRRRSPSPTCSATSTTPPPSLRELARVVRPGGTSRRSTSACRRRLARRSGSSTSSVGLPALGRRRSRRGWHEVGRFLGPSIRGFYEHRPEPRQLALCAKPGIGTSAPGAMSLGGGIVDRGAGEA